MIWLILVGVTVVVDSIRIFIDNYVSDVYFKQRDAVAQKYFYGFMYIITSIILLFALQIDLFSADWSVVGVIMLCGVISSISGIPYYRALELDDSTNFGIFMQVAPVLYLVLGWFVLGEKFSPVQLISFAIILTAPVLIVATARKRSRKIRLRAVFYALLYTIIAVIGNIIFVKVSGDGDYLWTEMPFFFFGKGVMNIISVLTHPKWHKRFKTVSKASNRKVYMPMTINHVLGVVADFAYRSSLVLAPAVAIASAVSDSVEPIAIFFMGILLTLIWPKFGREKMDRKTVFVHLIATSLVAAGILILQLS